MRVFVTGATGFVGSAVVPELIRAGHHVLGLARSDAGAKALTAAGAEVLRGDIADLDALQTAREKGFSTYVGEGKNDWPAVHRLDAATLYRLALEKGTAGSRYHGVGDEGIPTREIAEVIAKKLNVPAVSKSAEEAGALLGFIGHVLGMEGTASNALTRERLGWRPTHLGLIADLENGTYFN